MTESWYEVTKTLSICDMFWVTLNDLHDSISNDEAGRLQGHIAEAGSRDGECRIQEESS